MNDKAAAPSWAVLDGFVEGGSGLTTEGKDAVRAVLRELEELLGPTWLRRQHAAFDGLPIELVNFAFHAAALPQFLSLSLRLRAAATEPTFQPVRSALRRGLSSTNWRHLLLQLEVGRLGTSVGLRARFEPPIEGTDRSADVVLEGPSSQVPLVVETTSLFRALSDRQHQAYEQHLSWSLIGIERRYEVFIQTHVSAHLDDDATVAWLREVDAAAAEVQRTGIPQTVRGPVGTIMVRAEPPPEGTTTFLGAVAQGDGWRRLAQAVRGKVRQTAGSTSAWIRVDALDGFFQFTDWRGDSWPDRVDRLAAALRAATPDVSHVAGIVISSGLATSPGAVDPSVEDVTATTAAGVGLRRLVAPHLVRETFIVPLQPAVDDDVEVWTAGYAAEPSWLDEDLHSARLPALRALWQ